jgi:RHS repeat-associated protein
MLLLLLVSSTAAAEKTTMYFYTDPLGNVLATSDANGVVITSVDYRPYGAQVTGEAIVGAGFTGHVQDDETDLVYMQARYYDAQTAHFLSVDPSSGGAGNYFKFNRYLYVSGNPFYSMDPDGRDEECSLACRSLRAYSDYTSGIGQGLNDSSHGRGGPLGDKSVGDQVVVAHIYNEVAAGADAASAYADAAVGSLPGGDFAQCVADQCSPIGWVLAVAGGVPGEGAVGNGVLAAGARLAEFSQARNAALRWLEARGFKAVTNVFNRFPAASRGERVIGRATEDGRVGYRIEYDKRGAHFNTFSGKEKEHFYFEGTQKTVDSITDGLNR